MWNYWSFELGKILPLFTRIRQYVSVFTIVREKVYNKAKKRKMSRFWIWKKTLKRKKTCKVLETTQSLIAR